jgi:AraC-like DNA-binding protein
MMLQNKRSMPNRINVRGHISEMPWEKDKRLYHLRPFCRSLSGSDRYFDEHWQQAELRPGLRISMLKLPSGRTDILCYQKQPAMIDFGFILSGRLNHQLQKDVTERHVKVNSGLSGIGYFPGWKGVVEIPGGEMLRVLHVHVAPKLLRDLLGNELGGMPYNFQIIFDGRESSYLYRRAMDSSIEVVAQEIYRGGLNGSLKGLYLEGKALELIALQLKRLMSNGNDKQTHTRLSRNEKDRIRAAGDRLIQDLSTPPTLADLSSRFCLSMNKLQHGFREVYGYSVFGYLREHKMQKARLLFETAEMNVSQVAWEVGYVNVSQFTKAYKKRFGVLPRQYLRSIFGR